MLKKDEFCVLYALYQEKDTTQRNLAKRTGFSLGKVNALLNKLHEKGQISENYIVTEVGERELQYHKVDNAIIMAAGMSSRFAPLSYEKPKGLLIVKGERLIERQIRQLQEAGIQDITVVVGYMKEKFFYLQDKFHVDIVVNEDYYRYNNPSTLIRVLDKLKNTYICSSDNYFVDNVFEPYVYDSYYSAVWNEEESEEYGLIVDKKGKIRGIDHNPQKMWIMLGHVFFSKEFSKKFSAILLKEYEKESTRKELWEDLLERYLDQLDIYMRPYECDKVLEFDSLEELRNFDDRYLENSDSHIFENICRILNCRESDICGITVIKQGLTNLSFRFMCNGKQYVYRHPGVGTDQYISRESEAFSMDVAKKLGLDNTIIQMSGIEGWKLSRFIENARCLDYHNESEVRQALGIIKKLHDAAIHSQYDFDIWKRTISFIEQISNSHKNFEDFNTLYHKMLELYEHTKEDHVPWVLCHCDCYNPNFLLDDNDEMTLIDWEYSGNDDPANDLGTFICCSDYTYEEALKIFDIYYGRKPSSKELRHNLAYVAIESYYWYVWAIYQESIGNIVGEYLFIWYKNAKFYWKKAIELYSIDKENT